MRSVGLSTARPVLLLAIATLLSLASMDAAFAAGCDVSLLFQPVLGKIDDGLLKRVNNWAKANPTLVSSAEDRPLSGGARLICMIATPRTGVEPLFDAVRKQLPRTRTRAGFIGLYSRNGQSLRMNNFGAASGNGNGAPPRDNGIRVRPPVGERN